MASGMRRSTSSSTSGAFKALAKRPSTAAAEGVCGKPALSAPTKKRVALGNLTNQGNGLVGRGFAPHPTAAAKGAAPKLCSTSKTPVVKGSALRVQHKNLHRSSVVTSSSVKPKLVDIQKPAPSKASDAPVASIVGHIAPCSSALSPSRSAGGSASLDETMSMSTCDSIKSPSFVYIDNADSSVMASLERKANDNLRISEHPDEAGFTWKREVLTGIGTIDIADADSNHPDPQFCATLACDIYRHLRTAETKKRPSTDFMEVIQKDINASMRAILIDWLVEVAEEYRLVPDTLYLTVNYIDRYLSGNEVSRQKLQLLGVACMLIASKYEEICAPQVEEFCYITDNTYFRDEVLQMEAAVLKYLKFEMTAPTIKCFLRRFVRVAQQPDETPSLQLEFLASYIAELTLLEYSFLCYSPSMIAASAVFLAKFMLQPTTRPWNATLGHYTSYKPSDLCECIRALHHLVCNSPNNTLPAIREKYGQHKYKFVAKKYCPPSMLPDFLHDAVEQQ